ncbi:TIGR03619 family F420-dependent LLM class oxidoreductase [Actinomadura madurae]|uniref:TIGR03619 family F420-dependent LLM class oxidoreductase n=1 Tax=Actinomadura madurae TaxID=1993 RepID=UPI0020265208|nr:TIGR03619 family F420-dependent LLM class oxidoreductase [Actinomadura madurae]MCP9952412.1 TIGR03619 family F420-dependent LLM class oxidoreductase [Actinomadura madurae]MCP9981649.1 TIGR03619 family F420-dependent LLM class oxidoreductase [Actinomadura madurae]MCQ0006843.1 TIGR03619 family F420-dependent LLM class oxidoreductase [Actinomadura madurae]MCQ0017850.1 TIGR03619 family F420-dependent LLM class oxidoreductase [Actinomadura madurae]URM97935.1 TIGR03619 family F420-dependent LLM c
MTGTDPGTPGPPHGGGPHVGLILALTIRGLSVGAYPDMARVAQTAESHGFDSVWLCDHFLTLSPDDYVRDAGITADASDATPAAQGPSSIPLLECWTALSALSRDTTSLRLGTSVLCNSYRHPAVLAKMAATLDVISGGRVDLGLGAGWFQQEFEAYGIPFPSTGDRVSALAESLQVMRSVWTEANPRFRGEFYTIDGAICDPPPVQKPHPPLWIGGEGQRVGRIAVRHANGVNVRWWPAGKCAERRVLLDRECESIDRDPSTFELSVTTLLAPTESPEARQRLRARFRSIPESGLITGSPDACVERIHEYQAAGIDHFLFTIPDVADSDHLDVVGEQILPHLDTARAPQPA